MKPPRFGPLRYGFSTPPFDSLCPDIYLIHGALRRAPFPKEQTMSQFDSNEYPNARDAATRDDAAESGTFSPQRRRALKTLVQGSAALLSGIALEGWTSAASAQPMGPGMGPGMSPGMGMGPGMMMGGMMGSSQSAAGKPGLFDRTMPIPPQLFGTTDAKGVRTYALNAMAGQHAELIAGRRTPTWGYNGAYLGPTIRVPRGKPLHFDIRNGLDQSTTVHWHGAHIPGNVDGGPHNPIAPGDRARVAFTLDQPAASLWYHPHPDGRTGPQVYAGLAGFLLVDDGLDARLGMPHTYGVDDFPVVLQDRRLSDTGTLDYMTSMRDMMGMKGDRFLVNGVEQPYLSVPGQWIRLRVLNGANARAFNLTFADKHPFHVVGSDAGLLERPVERTHLVLASGERVEIMLDLRRMQGKRLVLRSDSAGVIPGMNRMPMAADGFDHGQFDLLELRVGAPAGQSGKMPARMAEIPTLNADGPHRQFILDGMEMRMMRGMMMGGGAPEGAASGPGGMRMGVGGRDLFAINGTFMDMKVINERVKLGSTELWTVTNQGMMAHPFHVHGTSFQIRSRDGAPPPAHERGWKDVVFVPSGQSVELLARFDQPADAAHPFMYHCHILEHEDNGMMGQFTVI